MTDLTKFEKALAEIIHHWGTPYESPYNAPEALREDAIRLIKLAEEQVLEEGYDIVLREEHLRLIRKDIFGHD